MAAETVNVLFVCVGNSARSQMAEGLTNHFGKRLNPNVEIKAYSCGTKPSNEVNIYAVEVMKEFIPDFDPPGPKYYTAVDDALSESGESIDYIFSVCEEKAKDCPVVVSPSAVAVNWRIPDPVSQEHVVGRSEGLKSNDMEYNLAVFRHTRDILSARIQEFVAFIDTEFWHKSADPEQKKSSLRRIHDSRFWSKDIAMLAETFAALGVFNTMWAEEPSNVESDVCFLSMPFKTDWSDTIRSVVERAADKAGFECARADDDTGPMVMSAVWHRICTTRVMIADISNGNPNVAYEVGLAHAVGRTVILLCEEGTEIPFNFRNVRVIPYSLTAPGQRKLSEDLKVRLSALSLSSSE